MEPGADPNAEASFVNPKAKIPVFVVNWSGGGGAASGAGVVARLDGGCERRAGGCEAAAARFAPQDHGQAGASADLGILHVEKKSFFITFVGPSWWTLAEKGAQESVKKKNAKQTRN